MMTIKTGVVGMLTFNEWEALSISIRHRRRQLLQIRQLMTLATNMQQKEDVDWTTQRFD